MDGARSLLVLGVGNVFYGDEGAGVHLVHYLRQKYDAPANVEIVDGGTLGWQLLNLIAEYDHVVLIDAVCAPPGKVYRFDREHIPDEIGYGKLSSHEWEVPDLLSAMDLYGDLPEVTCVAIGVRPLEFESGEIGVAFRDTLRERMPALATVVVQEIERQGVALRDLRPELAADQRFSAEEIVLTHA